MPLPPFVQELTAIGGKRLLTGRVVVVLRLGFTLLEGFNFFPFCMNVCVALCAGSWDRKREGGTRGTGSSKARKYIWQAEIRAKGIML